MKRNVLTLVIFLLNGFIHAQSIDFTLTVPITPFQDADLGSMDFADIDNDGDQDLIMIGKGGPIKTTLYINNGSGNFIASTGTAFVDVYGGTVGFADVNNDNFIDLLITGSTSSPTRTANLYMNNGNGTFTITTTPFTPSDGGDFAFEDIDNDNDLDLILTGYNSSSLGFTKLYQNNGSGVFSEVIPTSFEQLKSSCVAFIDIENDGDKDVVLAGKNNSNLNSTKLYTNDGNGNFTLDVSNSFINIDKGDIAIADSDGDGDLDILISGFSNTTYMTKLYVNDGSGSFSEVVGTPFVGAYLSATKFADFDNDGDADVLLLGAGDFFQGISSRASIYQNLGNNNFSLPYDLIGTYFASAAIADIDGDNDLDFIIGGTHSSTPTHNPKLYINNLNPPLSINDIDNGIDLSYFPNPSSSFVYFRSNHIIEKITLFNVTGQKVLSKNVNAKEINLDLLMTGSYFAEVEIKGKLKTLKLHKH